ncbi:MAG: hypothetical protein GY852_06430 [bacterium]|nr:hypothetical protein [bacterium]
MPGCPVEKTQEKILEIIANEGKKSAGLLVDGYARDELMRAAIKKLIFEDMGEFARSMLIEAVGKGNRLEDVEHVLMHLLGHEKGGTRANYSCLQNFGSATVMYHADKEEGVRNNALFAIEKILEGQGVLSLKSGRALVKCSLLDPSDLARITSARIIGKYATFATFSLLLTFIINAEKSEDYGLMERGENAMGIMVEGMKEDRPRGSLLKPLIGLSNASESMWDFASATILQLFHNSDIKNDIQSMLVRENSKLVVQGKKTDTLAMGRMDSLIRLMGEDFTTSIKRKKKMTAEAYLDGTFMVPPKQLRRPNRDPILIPRGPVVDAIYRAGRAIRRMVKCPRK